MGQLLSACFPVDPSSKYRIDATNEPTPTATPSWEKRPRLDPRDFLFSKLTTEGTVKWKSPGSIAGRAEMVVEECSNVALYIFDHSAQVTVDECKSCTIFIGPSEASVFIRNCEDCVIMVACQQFRTRDCKRCTVYLLVGTQPIIETSSEMRFGCFQAMYPGLDEQVQNAKLSIWNNEWWNVYDFNGGSGRHHVLEHSMTFTMPSEEHWKDIGDGFSVSIDRAQSVVPYTHGNKSGPNTGCLVLFDVGNREAMQLCRAIQQKLPTSTLIQTKSSAITPSLLSHSSIARKRIAKSTGFIALEFGQLQSEQDLHTIAELAQGQLQHERFHISADFAGVTADVQSAFAKQERL